jgi:hypothetical protein
MRPRFLDQPFFSQCAPRALQSRADYASPVVIHTTPWWRRLPDELVAACLVLAIFAFVGAALAWRG